MLKVKKMTQIYDMKVFTDTGEYFGDIEEGIIQSNKVFGWRVKATRNSTLNKILGGAKGVIVPHKFVKAVGDIMLISRQAIPSYKDEGEEGEHQQLVQG